MTRFLAILAALTCAASAQTYRTVTADTNNVIRTNFTLVRGQVTDLSGATFAISNVTGLQTALDGKLATNGNAFALTNFPASLLLTNGDAGGLTNFPSTLLRTNGNAGGLTNFPSSLLRTNGDGSGLTNLPNANLTNATGILPISNGGTGATNASLAISNLLPSYTGNSDRILALNSNATELIWTTNTGGGGGGTGAVTSVAMTVPAFLTVSGSPITNSGTLAVSLNTNALPITNGGTGGTNARAALQNLGVVTPFNTTQGSSVVLGVGITTNAQSSQANVIAIGYQVSATAPSTTDGNITIGSRATNNYNAIVIGNQATAVNSSTDVRSSVIAIGRLARVGLGIAIGSSAYTSGAETGDRHGPIQFGVGTNGTGGSIQIYNYGIVDSNKWAALANSTTYGRFIMAAPTNGTNGQILALNSNATAVVWTNVAGGGGGGTTVDLASTNATGILPITKGGTDGTNRETALNGLGFASSNNNSISLMNNGGTNVQDRHTVIGSGASAYGTNNAWEAVVIGAVAEVTNGGVAIGRQAVTQNGVSIGQQAKAMGQSVAIGLFADAQGGTVSASTPWTNIGSVAIGSFAVSEETLGTAIGSQALSEARGSVAVGWNARSGETNALGEAGTSIGYDTQSDGGIAIGYGTIAGNGIAIGNNTSTSDKNIAIGHRSYIDPFITNAIQLGTGTNNTGDSVQFWNTGPISTNTFVALANSTVFGRYIFEAPTNGTANQVLALNSNATAVVWTNNTGGSGTVDLASTNATGVLPIAKGGTGGTNANQVLTNVGILNTSNRVNIGPNSIGSSNSVSLGYSAGANSSGYGNFTAVGYDATIVRTGGTAVGDSSETQSTNGVAIGRFAEDKGDNENVAVGAFAIANTHRSVALGARAVVSDLTTNTNVVQIGIGTNSTSWSVQLYSAGAIDTNEWSRLAALSTYPTTNISVVGTNNTNTLVFSNGILVEVQ